MTGRIRVLILYGGQSAEHDVSRVSARYVLDCARTAGFEVDFVGITRGGRWVQPSPAAVELAAADGALPTLDEGEHAEPPLPQAHSPASPLPQAHSPASSLAASPVTAEQVLAERPGSTLVVFPVLHGPFGEDGTVQGLCEMAGVAYVGPGVLSSAVCMDKPVAKRLLEAAGLPVARHVTLRTDDIDDETPAELLGELGSPVFVKPANMGSSIGISKASDAAGVARALRTAAAYDERLLVEEFVPGRELEVSVLGNDKLRASLPGEIVPGGDFYDYADKYLNDTAQLHVPADVPGDIAEQCQQLATAACDALHVEGLARVDFLYDRAASPERQLLVSEINTMPGFTPISMYPRLWAICGVDGPALINELVHLAIDRHKRRTAHTRTSR